MAGPEEKDWVARLNRQLEPLQRAGQRFARDLEQASKAIAAAREAWRPHLEAWQQLSSAFVAARDRGDFRSLQFRLRLTFWIVRHIEAAKENPSRRSARAWLMVQHLTPKQIAVWLPYMMMDMGDLRVPKRRGRQKGRAAPSTLKMAGELDKRIADTGELPTTAARRLLANHGFRGDLKGPADHLVRVWKKRAFKSA
jgi:hypothetical protein